MTRRLYILNLTVCFALGLGLLRAEVRLPHLFGDHMVLQRNAPIKLWGWAEPGERISIIFQEKTYQSQTDPAGNWELELPALPAGGPYEMRIRSQNEIMLEDILIGDVWVCSGQSNMQWQIHQTAYQEQDSQFIQHNQMRLFTVAIDMDYQPRRDVKGGTWLSLRKEHIDQFSAVAFHFGKYLAQHSGVPIGLISSNLGATSIETWMSHEALMAFPQFHPDIQPLVESGKNFAELRADFERIREVWEQTHYLKGPGIAGQWQLPETDVSDWKEMQAPGVWEEQGLPNYDGAVWLRKEFDLPDGFSGDSMWIALSQLDDYDITWVNGHKIGETYGRHTHRNYFAPSSYLKPKGNVLVMRVFDIGDRGGFTTNSFWASQLVRGTWKYRPGLTLNAEQFQPISMPNATPFSSPGVLYNANIAPLTRLSVKGVIWYQGESNVNRAYEYRDLFPAMIQDWRRQWKRPDLPFLFVQLANYYPEQADPAPSTWAELREAQALTLKLDHTGMACTIDIGEANDIHPQNKEDVGIRLGMAALKVAYGQEIVHSGPQFTAVRFEGKSALIRFSHIGEGLVSHDKFGYVRGFQVAGVDRIFHWAKAEIQGNAVKVYAEAVARPVAVRYGWADNPGPLDLYNQAGLPAVPFRSDDWPAFTQDKKYDHLQSRF